MSGEAAAKTRPEYGTPQRGGQTATDVRREKAGDKLV